MFYIQYTTFSCHFQARSACYISSLAQLHWKRIQDVILLHCSIALSEDILKEWKAAVHQRKDQVGGTGHSQPRFGKFHPPRGYWYPYLIGSMIGLVCNDPNDGRRTRWRPLGIKLNERKWTEDMAYHAKEGLLLCLPQCSSFGFSGIYQHQWYPQDWHLPQHQRFSLSYCV